MSGVRERAAGTTRRSRLHLMVANACNNRCLFCLEDRAARAAADFADQERALEEHPHRDAVLFTCGEPTLAPRLPALVRRAAALGYREIELVTNGRKLAYASYCRLLVERGLNAVTVSIHGATPRVHDGVTRAPGSFAQTVQGLRHLADLRRQGAALTLTASTVLHRRNLSSVGAVVALVARLGVDRSVINYVQPAHEALRHYDALVPRLRAAAAALAALAAPPGVQLRVEGLPPCLLPGRPELAGAREAITVWRDGALHALEATRDQVKGPPCSGCALEPRCDGVWEEYARRHGFGELAPVRA